MKPSKLNFENRLLMNTKELQKARELIKQKEKDLKSLTSIQPLPDGDHKLTTDELYELYLLVKKHIK